MPSAFTHAFVALAAGGAVYGRRMPLKFWVLAPICSAVPDLDVGLFAIGIEYEALWGHRGMMHSLLFAAVFALFVMVAAFRSDFPLFSKRGWGLLLFFFVIIASHGFLDAFTNGGLGIAFFSPFDTNRYFFSHTPIEVSPLSVSGFFTQRGAVIMGSEIRWVWLPTVVLCAMVSAARSLVQRTLTSHTAPHRL